MWPVATDEGVGSELAPRLRSRWSKFRVVLACAVAVLLVAELAVRLAASSLAEPQAWPTPESQYKYDRVTQLAPTHRVKTVLFGDSMVDAGADPALMTRVPGVTFNAALAGETLPTIGSWATDVVVPRLHPKTVVLGFNVDVLSPNIPGAAAVQAAYSGSRVVKVAEGSGDVIDHLDTWLRTHIYLYRYRSVLRNVFAPSTSSGTSTYAPLLSNLGWNESFRDLHYSVGPNAITPKEAQAEIKDDVLHDFVVGSQPAAQLGAVIDQLRREGTRVVFVVMPIAADFVAAIPGGRATFEAALADLMADTRAHGAQTVNAGVWPNNLFASPAHLNGAGTARFSSWLSARLTGSGR
jgi:hypothetical protein